MPLGTFVEEAHAPAEVQEIYEDIKATRGTDYINNFWKVLANDPKTLRRTWQDLKEVMAPGALDTLAKELIYLAVSITNGCEYCTISHTAAARKAGMTKAMREELIAVVGMANQPARKRLSGGERRAVRAGGLVAVMPTGRFGAVPGGATGSSLAARKDGCLFG